MRCPVCSGDALRVEHENVFDFEHGTSSASSFARCNACESLVQAPAPSAEDLLRAYPADYRPHTVAHDVRSRAVASLKKIQAKRLVTSLAQHLPKDKSARILEIGCGAGHFLVALKEAGYTHVEGADMSAAGRSSLDAHGIPFHVLNVDDAMVEGAFDTIVMLYSIEHVRDPVAVLKRIHEHLAPSGTVVLLTPNPASLSAQVFSRYWSGIHAPRHVVVVSPKGMTLLANQAGFACACIPNMDPATWALSFQNVVTARLLDGHPPHGTAWWTLVGLPLWLAPAVIERSIGRTGSFIAVLS